MKCGICNKETGDNAACPDCVSVLLNRIGQLEKHVKDLEAWSRSFIRAKEAAQAELAASRKAG
jgi:hypothetical protein